MSSHWCVHPQFFKREIAVSIGVAFTHVHADSPIQAAGHVPSHGRGPGTQDKKPRERQLTVFRAAAWISGHCTYHIEYYGVNAGV